MLQEKTNKKRKEKKSKISVHHAELSDKYLFKIKNIGFEIEEDTKKFIHKIVPSIFLELRFKSSNMKNISNEVFSCDFFRRINMNTIIIVMGMNTHVVVLLTRTMKDRIV
jgi:TATA-box binding protein (TBP) (component of TFIID and TFIIIB)